MARAAPSALLALADAKAPSPTARRLPAVRGLRLVYGCRSFRRCRSTTLLSEVLSVLHCRALSYFGGGSHCALAGAHAAGACVARGPNSPCSWSRGAPLPLLLLPRSLRSRPPRAWRATGERCPPTAGFFIGCRQRAIMSAVAIAPSPLRQPCGGWGRALFTLPCRVSCRAPKGLVALHPHRPPWSALNAVGGSAALCRARLALAGVTSSSCACVRPSPHFPLPPHSCLASSASSGLSPLGRCRRFGSLAPALLVVSVLGSPMENAIAWGSSLPTTARPHFH